METNGLCAVSYVEGMERNMSDLISRQDAINAVIEWYGCEPKDIGIFEKIIEKLPSAQPEIIRCKDCKHFRKWRSEESAKKFGQIYGCARNVFDCPKPEDFCSKAERRTNAFD